ncbi:MAG: twin-arginine translocase subunit TatC [Candidatus Gottesmanbacteria bacterium]|nr:twin-arginine translocase subunit TatC [Candidatus Gottesmanbacteria bacterium]
MEQFSYELEALKGAIMRPLIAFVLLTTVLFTVGTPSFGTQLFLSAKAFLIPAGVSMVVLGPSSAFVAPLLMVVLIALMMTFPYMVYSFVRFLVPALRERERRALRFVIASSLILFYLGCALAYFIIIPQTFSILYSFATPLAVVPLFSLDAFISSVFLITLGVGVLFLLPVVMVLLTYVGVLSQTFWFTHWRGAVLAVLIFSAIITPDGTGVTMLFLSAPLGTLYVAGALMCKRTVTN